MKMGTTLVRYNEVNDIGFYYKLPKTELCEGAFTSTDKGRDDICCAFCDFIRLALYREKGYSTTNPLAIEFIDNFPMARTSCMISLCHPEKPLIFYYKRNSELDIDNYIDAFREQFRLRHQLRLIDKEISASQISFNNDHIPIVIPCDTTRRHDGKGDDKGVSVRPDGKAIRIRDIDKAFESGKWMFVINFYQALQMLENDIPGKEVIDSAIWLRTF